MRKNHLVIIVFTLAALIHWQKDVSARQTQTKCSEIGYSTPEVSRQAYRLDRIEGQAVFASPSEKWEPGTGNGVCLIIFDRKSKEPVARVTTDDKGLFEFANLAPGEYTLLASADDLQVISVPVQLIPASDAHKSRRLLLHLRVKLDQRKSYVTPVTHPALRKQLLMMVERDKNIRNDMIRNGVDHPSKEVLARMSLIDRRNTSRMKTIIKEYGWPGPALVGWDGSEAAFLLVQHAAHPTQKKLLPLMQKEYKSGNLSGPNYALFMDRVLVEDGRPQIYGSRARPFDQWKMGQPVLYPIEEEANVDKRRAEVGLAPLAEYLDFLKRMYYPPSK